MSEEDAPKVDKQKEKAPETGAVAMSQAVKSLVEALTALGKLALVLVVLILLWSNRAAVGTYAVQWLDSANKLGFLGLSIERQISAKDTIAKIADKKGARVSIESARGAITRAARNAPAIVGARILWVDDTPSNNVLEREVLETVGIEVFLVNSTKEALMFLPVLRPDLVISDVDREKDQAQPLRNCPAHFFEMPAGVAGDLGALNKDLLEGRTAATGFSLAEAISAIAPEYANHASRRIIFYTASAGGISASQCARLVTNRTDILLHAVVSALEERRWEKLRDQPQTDAK